jgi:hypothetical protein
VDWILTFAGTAAGVALAVFCGWRGSRPADPHRGVRLMPYRFLMILCAAWVLVMAVHILNLAGFSTGR